MEQWLSEHSDVLTGHKPPNIYPIVQTVESLAGSEPVAVFGSAPAAQVQDLLYRVQQGRDQPCYLIAPQHMLFRFETGSRVFPVAAGKRWIHWFGLGLRNMMSLGRKAIRHAFIPVTRGSGEGYGNVSRTARMIGAQRIYFVRDGQVVREIGSGFAALACETYRAMIDTAVVVCGAAFGLLVVLGVEIRSAIHRRGASGAELWHEPSDMEQENAVNE